MTRTITYERDSMVLQITDTKEDITAIEKLIADGVPLQPFILPMEYPSVTVFGLQNKEVNKYA